MKFYHLLLFVGTLTGQFKKLSAQTDTLSSDTTTYYIGTIDGGQFMGTIISKNDREYLIETKDKGKMYIPKYVITEIKAANETNRVNGNLFPPNPHPSRYFYAPSAFPVEEGNGYINCTYYLLYQAQYGLTKNISIGGTMTVLGMPALFNVKWSQKIKDKLYMSLGGQIGKTWWSSDGQTIGVGFANLTYGTEETNITVNGGYGFYGKNHIDIVSASAIHRISKKLSILAEVWTILQPNYNPIFFGGPGFRLYAGKKATWDFGFIALNFQEQYQAYDQFGNYQNLKRGHNYFPIPFIAATYKI